MVHRVTNCQSVLGGCQGVVLQLLVCFGRLLGCCYAVECFRKLPGCCYTVARVFCVVHRVTNCQSVLGGCQGVVMQLLVCFGRLLGYIYAVARCFGWFLEC